jgi:hypothetical protein
VRAPEQLFAPIEGVRQLDGEATLLGHAYFLGILHHAWFIQVSEAGGEQVGVNDPHGRLDDLHYLAGDGGPFATLAVPGFPGEYALVIAPAVR